MTAWLERMAWDLEFGGRAVSQVKVDPMLYGVGVGYRF
jgi:outer membrane protein W